MSVNTNSSMGGADALAAAAASLAAASVTFNNTDPNYAAEALQHSKQLYQMASSLQLQNHSYCGIAVPCQGSAVPLQESGEAGAAAAAAAEGTPAAEVAWVAYPSSSVYDDMAWAAAWLYKATGRRFCRLHGCLALWQYQCLPTATCTHSCTHVQLVSEPQDDFTCEC